MYPPRFDYQAPTTLDEALGLMDELGDDAKILAGGQSLIPMLKLRFAEPETLVDINGVSGLDGIHENGALVIGAMSRHNDLAHSELLRARYPILAEAGRWVADPLIRALGTVGGSLVHADPQADWGSVMLALNASVVLQSKSGGERVVGMDEFFEGLFSTAIEDTELLTRIHIPKRGARAGGWYLKMERKIGDFATAGVAAQLELDDNGVITKAGLGLTAMGPRSLKAHDAEKLLVGNKPSDELFEAAAEAADKICDPKDDVRGSAAYKRAVNKAFVKRALAKSIELAQS